MPLISDKFLRAAFEVVPDPVIGVNGLGLIVIVNEPAELLFGYSRSDLIGQPIEILVPLALRDAHATHRAGYDAHPVSRPMGIGMELVGRRKDGSAFAAEISLSSIETTTGRLTVAAIRDIGARTDEERARERQEALAAQDRLWNELNQSRRMETLGQLVGSVAHDFGNLVAVMLGYSTALTDQLPGAADSTLDHEALENLRSGLSQITSAAEQASHLTQQLLTFARRENVRAERLDLNAIVRDTEELLRRSIGTHISLVTRLASDLAPIVADRGQIQQILLNLAVNARDAMPSGGTLTIETQNFDVERESVELGDEKSTGGCVSLLVSDTGVGMSPDVLARAIEPFFTTKPSGQGTGLGLATVSDIIGRAGGAVRMNSELDRGTTVTIVLPSDANVDERITRAAVEVDAPG